MEVASLVSLDSSSLPLLPKQFDLECPHSLKIFVLTSTKYFPLRRGGKKEKYGRGLWRA